MAARLRIRTLVHAWVLSCILGWVLRYTMLHWTQLGEWYLKLPLGRSRTDLFATIESIVRIFQGVMFFIIVDLKLLGEMLAVNKQERVDITSTSGE